MSANRTTELDTMRLMLATFTEYQLVTLERLPARMSERERRRQQIIADEMVEACRRFGVALLQSVSLQAPHLPRLQARLSPQHEHHRPQLVKAAERGGLILEEGT